MSTAQTLLNRGAQTKVVASVTPWMTAVAVVLIVAVAVVLVAFKK